MASNYYCWHRLLQQQNPSRDATFLFEQVLSDLQQMQTWCRKITPLPLFCFSVASLKNEAIFVKTSKKRKIVKRQHFRDVATPILSASSQIFFADDTSKKISPSIGRYHDNLSNVNSTTGSSSITKCMDELTT